MRKPKKNILKYIYIFREKENIIKEKEERKRIIGRERNIESGRQREKEAGRPRRSARWQLAAALATDGPTERREGEGRESLEREEERAVNPCCSRSQGQRPCLLRPGRSRTARRHKRGATPAGTGQCQRWRLRVALGHPKEEGGGD